MADAGVLVELWQGGGGWLVCAGIAYLLIQRISPALVSYINAKATRERSMTEAISKVLEWPERIGDNIDDLRVAITDLKADNNKRFDEVKHHIATNTGVVHHLATVLEIKSPRVIPPYPTQKDGTE